MAGGERFAVVEPHRHASVLGTSANATDADVADAVAAAKAAAPGWAALPFDERAAVFLRAADLLAGPWRDTLNAATMLGQSKSVQQAEIDAACELIDFLRFNVHYARRVIAEQPRSAPGRVEPDGLAPARRVRHRHHPVQLHRHRRQPADGARAHGQHGGLEADPDPAGRRAPHDAAARGRGPARRRDQHGDR